MKRLIILTFSFIALMFALSFTTTEQRRELIWDRVMADGTPNTVAGWDSNGDPAEVSVSGGDMVLADVQTSTGKKTFQPDATNPGINIGAFAGDPSAPVNGDVWYNSSTNFLKARINGTTYSLSALTATQIGYGDANGRTTSSTNLLYSTVLGFRVRQTSTNPIAVFQNASGGTVMELGDGDITFSGSGARRVLINAGDEYKITTGNSSGAQETFSISAGSGNVTDNDGDHISFSGGSALATSGADGGNLTISPGGGDGAGADGNFIILNIPTADPCATAPAGTVWNNSGTLSICP